MERNQSTAELLAKALAERCSEDGFQLMTLSSARPDARPPVTIAREEGELRYRGLLPAEERLAQSTQDLLAHLLRQGLTQIYCQSSEATTYYDITGGKLRMRQESTHGPHDARPDTGAEEGPVRLPEAHRLLHAIGIATQDGRIRADKTRKYAQINRFVDLIADYIDRISPKRRIQVLDAGCGKSYLAFVVNYYIRDVLGRDCYIVGVDVNEDRVRDSESIRRQLGYDNMEFRCGIIRQYRPAEPPDLLLSLHACDTATDEAIAVGLELGARLIFLVPCCQHELLSQLQDNPLRHITRHPLYRARLADLLTDALRTCALEAAGYDVSVVEYVSPLDTPKNLMIRAERVGGRNRAALTRYRELADMFGVAPVLEEWVPWLKGDACSASGGRRRRR
ncbi:MAG: class I SAM-dependent methyltransferase [Armatimonadota bacterium]